MRDSGTERALERRLTAFMPAESHGLQVKVFSSRTSKTALFWAAFVLTRPLGAVVGDFLDKPHAQGGLELSRYLATACLFIAIVLLVALLPQRPAAATH